MATTDLLELSSSDRETLENWLVEFDTAWQQDALATWVANKLPKLDQRLRRSALAELVKVDLEQQWTRGRRLTLGSYLERFPDLGNAQTVAADLIFAEYQVRQQFGEPADLAELARRYPGQAAELSRLIHGDLGVQSLAPLSFELPPATARDRDTSQMRAATDTAVKAARGEAHDPAKTPDRQVSPAADEPAWPSAPTLVGALDASGRPAVAKVAPSGDRSQPAADQPQPKPANPLQRLARVPRWVWIATGCCAAAVLLGIVFYVQTNQGLVKIELSDPTAKVQIQVDGETISITGLDRPLRLRPGEHGLVVSGDDFETVTRSFTVKRGSDEPLRVTLVPKAEQVVQTPPPPPPVEPLPTPQPKLPPAPSGPLPTITNSIGLQLVQIPAGEFLMGSPDSDSEASSNEKPQHRVQITQPFYLGMFEVTQAQYQRVMGSNPSNFKDDSGLLPVETVSWQDAQEFCAKLSDLTDEKQAGRQYRLPTEAEWEYACRAGTQTKFSFGEDDKDRGEYAWFSGNSGGATHPIGQKKPNEWGLFDMHGNVWEWCADDLRGYTSAPTADLVGSAVASARSRRGGGWYNDGGRCRSAYRDGYWLVYRLRSLGFRVACSSSGK